MKKILLVMLLAVSFWSCSKEKKCDEVFANVPASELNDLKTYIQVNSIIADYHQKGFYYNIVAAGSGTKPNACADVTVRYTGRLTNGTVFDSNERITFNLSSLITGWKLGIPLIAPGGKIILYLPPSLGYGNRTVGSIPANSILIFEIEIRS